MSGSEFIYCYTDINLLNVVKIRIKADLKFLIVTAN